MAGTSSDIVVKTTASSICLRAPYQYREVCRYVKPGRWKPEWKCWIYPKTPESAARLIDAFGQDIIKCDGGEELDRLVTLREDKRPQDAIIDPGGIGNLRTTPWKHQRLGYKFAMTRDVGCLLEMGMGCGKTLVAIGVATNKGNRTLILTPKSVVDVWPKEFGKHCGVPYKVIPLEQNGVDAKYKALNKFLQNDHGDTHVAVVVNYESAWRGMLGNLLLSSRFNTVIFDEIHKIKTPGGKASKWCFKLAQGVNFRLGLTGTPMPHSPLDIFAQYRVLDDTLYGRAFHRFKQRFSILGGFGGKQVVGYRNREEFLETYQQIAFQVGRDVLDLPDALHDQVYVKLSDKAMKTYRELESDLFTQIEDGTVTVANAMVKVIRLQQLTGGYLPLDKECSDEPDRAQELDKGKYEALCELVEGAGDEPMVVFCRFRRDLDNVARACASVGASHAELSGRKRDLKDWQEGRYQVLGVQIQSGGVGVDLTRARYGVYYSVGHSLGDYEQSLARIHRPGQERPVTYYHLIAKGTIDEKVYAALQAKKDVIESILNHVKE